MTQDWVANVRQASHIHLLCCLYLNAQWLSTHDTKPLGNMWTSATHTCLTPIVSTGHHNTEALGSRHDDLSMTHTLAWHIWIHVRHNSWPLTSTHDNITPHLLVDVRCTVLVVDTSVHSRCCWIHDHRNCSTQQVYHMMREYLTSITMHALRHTLFLSTRFIGHNINC